MKVLGINQVREILKAPRNKNTISRAVSLQKRLRFHSETNLSESDISAPTQEFLRWVEGLLPKDKYNTFLQLFSFPLPTASIVEDVYRELERVFYSRNPSISYRFTDSSLLDDWKSYKSEVLNEPSVWKSDGWQNMKTAINSILVVDLPVAQTSEKPEPYFYWLDISKVVDFETTDGTELEWLITKVNDETFCIFDAESYRVIRVKNNEIVSTVTEVKHDLGYCPAQFFWTNYAIATNKAIKKNSIVKQLSNLDWLLFFMTSKKHLDLYAPYPIYSAYEADCSFNNNETGDYCDGGFLRNTDNNYIITHSGLLERCPVCEQKRVTGPGSFLEVPIPSENSPDLKNPVQITTVDDKSLAYNAKECERLKNEIIVSCVGSNGLVSEKEAINTVQVAANFENKTSVLNNLKTNFERAQQFVNDTVCRLRYGSDFISSSVNWGSEFYVFTIDELYAKYKLAKDNGATMTELDSILNQIIETEYRDNPTMLQRMHILKHVEPFRHLSVTEASLLYDKGLVSYEDISVKINLSSFIDKFERENLNVVEFGSSLSLDKKINIITQTIYNYVKKIERPVGKEGVIAA